MSSLKFDADGDFFSVKNDKLHVNYAQADYVSSHTATPPHQYPSAKMTNFVHGPNKFYRLMPHSQWRSH